MATIGKTGRNERLKLEAQTINAAGLGIFAVGVLQPIFAVHADLATAAKVASSLAGCYLLHRIAKGRLARLED